MSRMTSSRLLGLETGDWLILILGVAVVGVLAMLI
jgi:hypothetical protein